MIQAITGILNQVLTAFFNFTNNYGISIILLTIVMRVVTWPLTNKQLSSAKAMQELQPEIKKLQEKYKNDKEKLNQETMELWKKHKVNPAAGCLPLIIQMPILFAMFQLLKNIPTDIPDAQLMFLGAHMHFSVGMLKNAPPQVWAASHYLLVFLSGATTYVQQKMMTTDKSQAAMLIAMPLMLLYFSIQFPAGLVLYWVVNNILSIGHHYLLNKKPAKGA